MVLVPSPVGRAYSTIPLLLMVFAFRFRRNAILLFAHYAVYEEDKTPYFSLSSGTNLPTYPRHSRSSLVRY